MLVNLICFLLSLSLLSADRTYNLYSPEIDIPSIHDGETMHFGFWIYADMPDYGWFSWDGDGDDYLEDYYKISILYYLSLCY